jgi:hypothetical protein
VRYGKEAVARKIKLDRWRPATADEVKALRSSLSAPPPEVSDPGP